MKRVRFAILPLSLLFAGCIYRTYIIEPGETAAPVSAAGSWERLPDLPIPVRAPAVATDGERIFVFGGSTNGNVRVRHTQIFDPGPQRWGQGAPTPEAVEYGSAVHADRRLHVMGGWTNAVAASNAHWIYDPVEDTWETGPPMPYGATAAAAARIESEIYVVGGVDGPSAYSTHVRAYDLESRSWSSRGPAPVAHVHWQGATIDGAFFVVGGSSSRRVTSSTLYRYDPGSGQWSVHASLPEPNEGFGGAEVSGRYCVLGGRITPRSGSFNTPKDRGYCYHPANDQWAPTPRLPTAVQEVGATGLDGALYAIGGRISYDGVTGDVYRLRF